MTPGSTVRPARVLPVPIVSGIGEEDGKASALGLGADDYLTTPFLFGDLAA